MGYSKPVEGAEQKPVSLFSFDFDFDFMCGFLFFCFWEERRWMDGLGVGRELGVKDSSSTAHNSTQLS